MASVAYPHIRLVPDEPPCLKRLPRIRIAQIAMDYLAHGWSAEEMCRQHPDLELAEVHAAMAYYFDHQQEIDEEIRCEWEAVGKDCSTRKQSPFYVRLHAQGRL